VTSIPKTWITAVVGVIAAISLWAQQLGVRATKEELRISAPRFHFLTGKPLQRIQNGNAVAFDFQLSALGDGKVTVLRRAFDRFVISYDLWEEKFSVTRMRSKQASAAHLSATDVETWCLDAITMSPTGLPTDRPIWIRLDIRAQEPKESLISEPGISITQLIEIFSRAGKTQQENTWRVESGPIRMDALLNSGRSGD
jgi:hypothetical protein